MKRRHVQKEPENSVPISFLSFDIAFHFCSAPCEDNAQSSGSDPPTAHSDENLRDEVQEVHKLEREDTLTASPSSVPKIVPQPSALAVSPW